MKNDQQLDWHVQQAMKAGINAAQLPLVGSDHGVQHWCRVYANARIMAAAMPSGANLRVAAWFAFLHDCQRVNEGHDPEHGPRGARHAASIIPAEGIPLERRELEFLVLAIELHSTGVMEGPLECRVCWDADRLDLWRVGVKPDPRRMTTTVGRKIAERAGWAR